MDKPRPVLIVDDDPSILALLTAIVRREGFEVQTARDGISGIVELQVAKYCVVLLDLMMPNFDGISVIRYLDKHHRDILRRVIVITASGTEPVMEEIRATEVFAVLGKPFIPQEVADAVRRCAATVAAPPLRPGS
ncbi:MAG TPA: response regulator [Thermoanaerobaculia bacterium]|nr:response regulator [Thermoanaerobaculia bacterium]